MPPVVHVQLTGKSAGVLALIVLGLLGLLALVWLVFGPGPAIAGGIGLVLLVRGLFALFTPPRD